MPDPSGYLPPHELRGLYGNVADGDTPGAPAIAHGSPGLATAATSGSPLAPAIAMDDPAALAIGIARVVDDQFGVSVVPVPTPDSVATGAGMSAPASFGPTRGLAAATNAPIAVAIDDPAALASSIERVIADPFATTLPPAPTLDAIAATLTAASPGLATTAVSPAPMMPTIAHDPLALLATLPAGVDALAVPGDQLAARAALATTPGISPQLAPAGVIPAIDPQIAAGPATSSTFAAPTATAPTAAPTTPTVPSSAAVAIPTFAMPTFATPTAALPTLPTLPPGFAALPFVSSDAVQLPGAPMPDSMPSIPTVPSVPTALRGERVRDANIVALDEVGGVMHVPLTDVPLLDQTAAAAPPVGGTGAVLSPPNVAVPSWTAPEHVPYVDVPRVESGEPIRRTTGTAFDPYRVRRDFPILDERVHGKRLVWLDNAATTQKPRAVIDRLTYFYEHENSNVHRAAHALAARATDAFESARETTRKFLNAPSPSEIVFVRGATEGINLIAKAWGRRYVERGDEIVLTHLEHHANIVPWQQLCSDTGARLRVAPVDDRGDVMLDEFEKLMCSRTRVVAFTQVSNALGTITPAREMIEIAHRWGAMVVLDGAQAVSHMAVDVQELDCDFYVFSGHKVFAPTGIGAVFGKRAVLDQMPPWQGGGNMIQDVTFERTLYQAPPWRFEAGTGNIADAAGMGAALDYVLRIGMTTIDRYEHELLEYATEQLCTVRGLHLIGTARRKAGVLSFILDGQRTEDVGSALDKHGIAVRSGHHCAQPILRRYGLEASVRASLAFYNVREDIDALVTALRELQASV